MPEKKDYYCLLYGFILHWTNELFCFKKMIFSVNAWKFRFFPHDLSTARWKKSWKPAIICDDSKVWNNKLFLYMLSTMFSAGAGDSGPHSAVDLDWKPKLPFTRREGPRGLPALGTMTPNENFKSLFISLGGNCQKRGKKKKKKISSWRLSFSSDAEGRVTWQLHQYHSIKQC